jgi:hypothetical protein
MTTTRWNAEEQFDGKESIGIVLFDQYRQPIATFSGIGYPDFANAKLCAAAPDLLIALQNLLAVMPEKQDSRYERAAALKAIEAATAD